MIEIGFLIGGFALKKRCQNMVEELPLKVWCQRCCEFHEIKELVRKSCKNNLCYCCKKTEYVLLTIGECLCDSTEVMINCVEGK